MTYGRQIERHLNRFSLPLAYTEWASITQSRADWHRRVNKPPFTIGEPFLRRRRGDYRRTAEQKRKGEARRAADQERIRWHAELREHSEPPLFESPPAMADSAPSSKVPIAGAKKQGLRLQ